MELEKFCFICSLSKPVSDFNKQSRAKDGLQSRCKSCFEKYRSERKQKTKEYNDAYRVLNLEKLKKSKAEYKFKNKEIIRQKNKEYNEKNKERRNAYHRGKIKSDIQYRLRHNFRAYMSLSIRKNISKISIKDMFVGKLKHLDYSMPELISHIESMFKDGMSWDNYGIKTWHIDHIKPLFMFDLSDANQIKEAWSLNNLQPLFAKENLSKNKKYTS